MQEIIDRLLKNKGGEWASLLSEKAGFSMPEAKGFIPAAVGKVTELFQGGKFDLSSIFTGTPDIQKIVEQVNTQDLAKSTGITTEKAADGLKTMLPGFLDTVKNKAGDVSGLMGMLGSGEKSGLMGSVGKLFGK